VPGFSEAVIAVPVTISTFRMVRQAIGMATDHGARKITYEMKGKLSGSLFAKRFATNGEFELPAPGATPTSE
jgi:hypothetical protein